jgi:hypothetical protein
MVDRKYRGGDEGFKEQDERRGVTEEGRGERHEG